jgi:hypothetical protein
MKIENKDYTDVSKVSVSVIEKCVAKKIIIEKHYLHSFSSCRYSFGVFYDGKLIGCIVYGHPVGRQTVTSIFTNIILERDKVLELTRLYIDDGYGTNIESYVIGLTFDILRKDGIDVLISYSDPGVGHKGKIYQATNWIYQGNNTMLIKGYWFYINGIKMHPRTVVSKFGSIKNDVLILVDQGYKRIEMLKKHRYLYILNKKFRKHGILKHKGKCYE